MAKHCVRRKRVHGVKRCAKFAGSGKRHGKRGKKCLRRKMTSAGKRCAKFR